VADGLLAGRRALITGAARGIGLATARRFRDDGAAVCLADVLEAEVAREAASLGAPHVVVDVADEADVERAVEEAADALGGLDVLVANAGILRVGTIADAPLDDVRRVLDVNLMGVFLQYRAAARRFRAQGHGVILGTASQAGRHGYAALGAYCASKFGVVALTETLAKELAPHGVRVNCVAPALVATTMQDELAEGYASARGRGEAAADIRARMVATVPSARMADAAEVAAVFAFLASDLASYVSGVTIPIDLGEGT
jgi:NAD(P)-dependent dehydrogenase (short-subunit alcohol dehydrogenase family)